MEITKRTLLGAGLALGAGAAAKAQPATGLPFVTHHRGEFGGRQIAYTATVGETILADAEAARGPRARLITTSYVLDGGDPAKRPVLFAFNGGPSTSSATLHMVALGPKRIVLAQEPKDPAPPPAMVDNPLCVLDVADIVFIDPAETGFSRILQQSARPYFYSVDGDAQSISNFVVAWSRANGRMDAPKFVLGESYGTMRAAVMAGQLAKVAPLEGVFLFGQAVNMIETSQRAKNAVSYATNITALAAIAAYHGKAKGLPKDPAAIVETAYRFGMGEYLQALLRSGDLTAAERNKLAAKLEAMTGIGADYYLAHDLVIPKTAFSRELLRKEGQILGTYDARYVGPAPKPGERAVDPAAKLQSAIQPMMLEHYAKNLGVTLPAADYRAIAPGVESWDWSGTLGPGGPFLDYDYQARLSEAFKANPRFRLMIGSGYYDLTTTIGPARYMVSRSDWPRDRVTQRQYVGGHMAYTDAATHKAFTNDIRAWIAGVKPP